jgi:hypothetical protein
MVYKTTTTIPGHMISATGKSVPMRAAGSTAKQAGTQVTDLRMNPAPKSRRLHRKEAALYLGVSLSWLDKARMAGLGPAFIKIGARVVYDVADLDFYLRQNRHATGFGP